ncbi:nitronate monooxygenase [Mycolicibacterium sp. ND9-15]|uniref:NAD(P)H-dependent flavin oxidoreductase n=1 Tax=Mycolicibacterium sp. ND9-15 TaxID=3042320 RepID=UPI002DDAF3E4|nr:nitronate monooxygenase [Mycolicibacterium sp. ND9-15]WSE57841.1 nitronate monooxygenase [Mycolicibacterium sp. ND9-15]
MTADFDVRSLTVPVVQAGMGYVAGHELAAAVSEAGGLGTIAGVRAVIATEIAAARRLTGRPIAVNLLLPFVRPGDVEAAAAADVIVTFWGAPRRLAAGTWVHQCGSVEEAQAAAHAGADAVIAQGVEAGGHVRGTAPGLELLDRIRAAVKIPVLVAGGIVDAQGVRQALDAGAVAAVVGTRFLVSEESHAHAEYKRRCVDADETVLTELFGLGWPDAPHRVIPNVATRRWLRGGDRGPSWIRRANQAMTGPVTALPVAAQNRVLKLQPPQLPFLVPQPPTDDGPEKLVDWRPLYAGANVGRIADIQPAAELVKMLSP